MFEFLNHVKNYVVAYWNSLWKYRMARTTAPTVTRDTVAPATDSHSNPEESNTVKRRRRRRKKHTTEIDSQVIEDSGTPELMQNELAELTTHSLLHTVDTPSSSVRIAVELSSSAAPWLDSESISLDSVDKPQDDEVAVAPISFVPAVVLPKTEPVHTETKSDTESPRRRVIQQDQSVTTDAPVSKPDDVTQHMPSTNNETSTPAITSTSSTTFFSPATKKNATVLSLQRSQLPKTMMDLVDKLRGQFPSARFFITGAAPEDCLDNLTPNDYDLLIVDKSSIYAINQFLNLQRYKSEVRSVKYPVIFCDLTEGLTLDFSVISPSDELSIQQLLENDFKKRDFNLNAFYCELTQEDNFEIFSFADALDNRKKKIISFTNSEIDCFEKDPTRLFRLCHLMIKHPTYSLHKQVKEALISLRTVENGIPKWYTVFTNYVQTPGNGERLTHAIRKLFVRHSYEQINKALHILGLLSLFTDNSWTSANEACSKIPPVTPESKLLMWLMANVFQRLENGKKDQALPLNPFLYLYYIEHQHLAYAYSHGPRARSMHPIWKNMPIETLISNFKLPEKEAPAAVANFSP